MFKSSIKSITDTILIGEDQFFQSISKDGSEKVVIQIPYYPDSGCYHALKLTGLIPEIMQKIKFQKREPMQAVADRIPNLYDDAFWKSRNLS
jgi:hypothetical protein